MSTLTSMGIFSFERLDGTLETLDRYLRYSKKEIQD